MNKLAFVVCMLISSIAWADIPLMVGGHAHAARNIQTLKDLGLGNFVWIPKVNYSMGNTPWDKNNDIVADVDACVSNGLYFMISQRRGLGPDLRPGGYEYGGDCSSELHDRKTIQTIISKSGRLFAGLHAEELDADLIQSAVRPSYMTRIPELYDFTDRCGGRSKFEGELIRQKNLYHSWGAKYIPNLCVTSHISGFRIGADIVIAELLEHLTTTELQLAYLRGGSQQFGSDWGVWVSPWYRGEVPCTDKKFWPAKQAVVGGGHMASEFKRTFYLSFVSGARLLTMQETEPLFSPDASGGYKLDPWGEVLRSFWNYASKHDKRFEPIVPTALMIDKDNGWSPGGLWGDWIDEDRVWGKLPVQWGDKMMPAFLNIFLPNFNIKREAGPERKDVYPGFFAATPLGPFDVVATDISAAKLAKYPLVILVGDVEMTQELLVTLRDYVNSGGTLLINVFQMRRNMTIIQDEQFLGARLGNPSQYWNRAFNSMKIKCTSELTSLGQTEFDEPPFMAFEVCPTTAKILATDGNGQPVLLRHDVGKGKVYLTTPEYMMEGFFGRKTVLNFFKTIIPTMVNKTPVWVESEGDTSWVAARQGSEIVVALANHAKLPRNVELIIKGGDKASLDVGTGHLDVKREADTCRCKLTISPEDVAIVRVAAGS
ncbi:MAG: hypothetical protein ACPL7O_03370 [Armatimonadota bacterium]